MSLAVDHERLAAAAVAILRGNTVDQAGADDQQRVYTVPTHGLYPHQWNWDSAISAVGLCHVDTGRAWTELETLLRAQDGDGLLAHIAFNPAAASYQPGPEWWGSRRGGDGRHISCITQPPVAAMALRALLRATGDRERARPLLAPLQRWHDWFLSVRNPEGRDEPVIVHPWETGRDNAVEWDAALACCPEAEIQRVDTGFVSAEQRPTKQHYRHYIGLVEQFRQMEWDQHRMAVDSAFRVLDPAMSAILAGACADLAAVADECADDSVAAAARDQSRRISAALDARRDDDGRAWTLNLVSGETVRRPSCALGLQLLQPDLDPAIVDSLSADVLDGDVGSKWGVCSTGRSDAAFDPRNYWRGPTWAQITWLVAEGLRRHGREAGAAQLDAQILRAVGGAGFHEYFSPLTGEGLGGDQFSWTAAVTLDALSRAGG